MKLSHKFVKTIPDHLSDGVLYISMEYATAIHKCCCGCGNRVVTPFSPNDWSLFFNGREITLDPSIGNWNFPCKSHYWIRNNEVVWAPKWTQQRMKQVQKQDLSNRQAYLLKTNKKSLLTLIESIFRK